MKNLILSLFVIPGLYASDSVNNEYVEAMRKAITEVYMAQNPAALNGPINAFERIGKAEPEKWEPRYYKGYGLLMQGIMNEQPEEKDKYFDRALEAVDAGREISKDNVELWTLKGFVLMMKLNVDPQARGQEYAVLAMQAFGKALAIDDQNPRALYLMASMQYGSAQFMGNDTGEACGMLHKSIKQFDQYETENPLAPQWGKAFAEGMLGACQ
ncbi:MAG: hypothetical protein OEX02_11520 [Cyclobacteriaceae bacterium]|nr:hypothetical protein [Cyclobacteriaceae bacterium]